MPLANLLQCSKKQNSMRKACWNALHRSHRAASNRRVSDRLYSNRWSLIDSLRGIKYKLNLFHWNKWPRKNFVYGVFVKYTRFSILSAFTFVRSRHFFSMQSWHVSYLQSRCPMVSVHCAAKPDSSTLGCQVTRTRPVEIFSFCQSMTRVLLRTSVSILSSLIAYI